MLGTLLKKYIIRIAGTRIAFTITRSGITRSRIIVPVVIFLTTGSTVSPIIIIIRVIATTTATTEGFSGRFLLARIFGPETSAEADDEDEDDSNDYAGDYNSFFGVFFCKKVSMVFFLDNKRIKNTHFQRLYTSFSHSWQHHPSLYHS